jgi:predicted metalloprotease with PDZ domain
MSANTEKSTVVYHVRMPDPDAHLFEVSCRIEEPDREGQSFSMPAWIPGSYLVRDYARHVVTVEAEADGQPVPLRKIDKSTWQVAEVNGPLLLRAEIFANDLSVRGAYLDRDHAFLNGACLFFRIHGLDDERCVVHIAPPVAAPEKAWKVATGLRRLTGDQHEFGAFIAMSYADLIDRPVLMGDLSLGGFDVAGIEHVIAISGRHDADLPRLERDLGKLCTEHANFFGGLPMRRYVFLVTVLNEGYGGLEHGNSAALVCSRASLPTPGRAGVSSDYRDFLGLASHEYFHLWNVKRIRPAEFVPYALEREAYTRQLWVFEGMTSFYDDLGLLRSGLITRESYLELLGRTLTAVYRSQGRRHQTLEDSSFDAWIKFYRQDENAPNAIVSYYSKGAMLALVLDLELRLKTDGQYSLDDVMRAVWQQYGQAGSHGLPEGGFERIAEEVSGLNLTIFFKQALRGTVDPPAGILLAQFGVRLHMRPMMSETDRGGTPDQPDDRPRVWLGFRTRRHGDRLRIRYVPGAGPARSAGLSANDELVALNGARVTVGNLSALLDRLDAGQSVEIDVFRRDELIHATVVAATPPRDTCYLSIDAEADAAAVMRRQSWLGG